MNSEMVKQWLLAIGHHWVDKRGCGHTTLMRDGTDNVKCLLLSHSRHYTLWCVGTLGRPIYKPEDLVGETRPLAVDHWFLGDLLLSALDRIKTLEAQAKKDPVG